MESLLRVRPNLDVEPWLPASAGKRSAPRRDAVAYRGGEFDRRLINVATLERIRRDDTASFDQLVPVVVADHRDRSDDLRAAHTPERFGHRPIATLSTNRIVALRTGHGHRWIGGLVGVGRFVLLGRTGL